MKILFFASLRERLGVDSVEIPFPGGTVNDAIDALTSRGEPWATHLQSGKVLAAINQEMVPLDTPVSESDELAFFPPVTGG